MSDVAVLLPVKAFDDAKARLAPALSASDRAALARRMATTVVEAAAPLPVTIVCDSTEVAEWAHEDRYFGLDEELAMLSQAGFARPECFWRRGSQAIIGGRAG